MASITEAAHPPARPLSVFAVSIMLLLCLSWGINNVMVKLALPEVPPLMQATARSIGGFFVILIASILRGIPLFRRDGTLSAGLLMGTVFAFEFVVIFFGLLHTTASRAVIFMYTAPFFVAFGAVNLLGERLRADQWAGLALAFVGIVVAIGVPQADVDANVMFGDLLLILGAIGWGGTTLIFKMSNLAKAPAEKTLHLSDRRVGAAAGARFLALRAKPDRCRVRWRWPRWPIRPSGWSGSRSCSGTC